MNIFAVIDWIFNIYWGLLFVYILMSWLPQVRESPVGEFVATLCEPYLSVFRRFIPPIGMIDFSPVVALFTLGFVKYGLMIVVQFVMNLFI